MKHVLALAAVSVFAVGCNNDSDGPTVVIGAVIDQTGNNSELSWIQAIELAADQFNDALEAEGITDYRFAINSQNSENDVVGGSDSRAIRRIRDAIDRGAKAAALDTTQIAEEANKPANTDSFQIPLQCSSCTGGGFLNATNATPTDLDLQASRRNAEFWMSRTIMSTALQAQVVSQLIRASVSPVSGLAGDLNNDGIVKVVNFGSDEAFGQSTTTAVATELLKLVPVSDQSKVQFERRLHPNAQDARDIDFVAEISAMLDTTNPDMVPNGSGLYPNNPQFNPPAGGGAAITPDASNTADKAPDFITMASFGRNHVAFVDAFKSSPPPGLGDTLRVIHFQAFRFSSNLLVLGELAEGETGVSHAVTDGVQGDQFAEDFRAKFGLVPVYRDAIYFDNAMTLILATFRAIQDAADPSAVAGAAIRDFMPCSSATAARRYAPTCTPTPPAASCVARPSTACDPDGPGGVVQVGPGVENIRAAIRAIQQRQGIEYTGASGPVDYDALGNIKNKVSNFVVQGGRYVDLAKFDCVSANTCPCLAAESTACPGQ